MRRILDESRTRINTKCISAPRVDEEPQPSESDLDRAIFWAARIRHRELHLDDLAICTVRKHVAALERAVQTSQGSWTYRGLCPGCGRAVELEKQ